MSPAPSLHNVLRRRKYKIKVRPFLNKDNSSINKVNQNGETPILVVLGKDNCSANVVKILIQYGANLNCKDRHGRSPLNYALQLQRDEAIIRTLLKAPGLSSINEVDAFNEVPLLSALKNNYSANIVKLLLKCGADINFRDTQGRSLLIHALQCACNGSIIHVLLEALDVTFLNEIDAFYRVPPLVFALMQHICYINVIKLLLQYGARVDFRIRRRNPPFVLALFRYFCNRAKPEDGTIAKLLMKYTYLKVEDYDIELHVEVNENAGFYGYATECAHEIQEMTSMRVAGRDRTLREIIRADSVQGVAADMEEMENILNLLLRRRLDTVCPIYFDIMLEKVSKQIMTSKLHEVIVYKWTHFHSISGLGKVLLKYGCACEMARLLDKDELFGLILAFYIPHD